MYGLPGPQLEGLKEERKATVEIDAGIGAFITRLEIQTIVGAEEETRRGYEGRGPEYYITCTVEDRVAGREFQLRVGSDPPPHKLATPFVHRHVLGGFETLKYAEARLSVGIIEPTQNPSLEQDVEASFQSRLFRIQTICAGLYP
ncbi:hypothetical protein PM082_003946 [Marasmius tenuissimus]|nr:hypothetical protein PM082_003946 [Marasmius tenuissimus]